MKISYNWLQKYFEEKLPEPEKISDGIIFHSFEVEDMEVKGDDTIFDIKILPDRAHDCLSHWGIAKEISAIFDIPVRTVEKKYFEVLGRGELEPVPDHQNTFSSTVLNIQVEDDKCKRYMGRIVRGVKVGESPLWLREKLELIGQRSINNIVDAANYVMFDLGQPIHAFDLDKLASSKIIVRNGVAGEKITTLDKRDIDLDESILIIADEHDPLAIAGIKGGTKAEVDSNTKNIVIEVANFNPVTTRKTAKKINILTDAVKRYENELSPELCSIVMNAITNMVQSIAGGEVESIVDIYKNKVENKTIKISVDYINKRLGSSFDKGEIENVWKKLNFTYSFEDEFFIINIPALRIDLVGPHDLTEEVIRILGYDRLPEILPELKSKQKVNDLYFKILFVRNKLLSDGYSEVMTYVFRDSGDREVLASASGKNFLRSNLKDGLTESIKLNNLNSPLLSMDNAKVFEIGTVFSKDEEVMNVAYGDNKNILEMTLDEFFIKNFEGEISFDKFISLLPKTLDNNETKVFKQWSIYPFISRDIAVWLPNNIDKDELVKIYKEYGGDLLVIPPRLFDKFTKNDRTSYAYRLVFQSYEKTLRDEEINEIMENITKKILSLGFEVR